MSSLRKSLEKGSLGPLSGCSYLFSDLSSGSCNPVLGGGLSTAVFSRNCWIGPEGTCNPSATSGQAAVNLVLEQSIHPELPPESKPFLQQPTHHLCSVDIRPTLWRGLMGVGATHAQNFSPCIRPAELLLLLRDGAVHTAQRRDESQVNRRRLQDQPGASNRLKS